MQWIANPGPVYNFLWHIWHLKCFAFWCCIRIFSSSKSLLQYLVNIKVQNTAQKMTLTPTKTSVKPVAVVWLPTSKLQQREISIGEWSNLWMNISSNEFQNKNRKPEMIVHVCSTNTKGSRGRQTLWIWGQPTRHNSFQASQGLHSGILWNQ